MAEFAQTHIELIDESQYAAGAATVAPLYVFATAQDKVNNVATGIIATGTTKAMANKLAVVTSKSDVINKFGVPYFEETNGTINQSSELNEVGLYGLWDAMGSSNFAYALRADIDVSQLSPTDAEPTAPAKNGTKWLDLTNTKFGLAISNGNPTASRAWTTVSNVLILSKEDVVVNGTGYDVTKPVTEVGAIAVWFDGTTQFTYQAFSDNKWKEIGSTAWFASQPSNAVTSNMIVLPEQGDECEIDGVTLTFNDYEVVSATAVCNKINTEITTVFAEVIGAGVNQKIVITKTKGLLTLIDSIGSPLEKLGFIKDINDEFIINSVSVYFAPATAYPSGIVSGSIWVKTTPQNNGVAYATKQYNGTTKIWKDVPAPMVSSFIDAEKSYSNALVDGSLVAKYNSTSKEVEVVFYQFIGGTNTRITATGTQMNIPAGTITIASLVNGSKVIAPITTNNQLTKEDYVDELNIQMASGGLVGFSALLNETGNLVIASETKYTVDIEETTNIILPALGLVKGEWSHWEKTTLVGDLYEPRLDATEGTLWYNDSFVVDMMVTDGNSWKGYKNVYPTANIFVQSDEPLIGLTQDSLWINPADKNYPAIKRYYNGVWEAVDMTDQTTPLGCLFADIRENAGYAYAGSTHVPYSTNLADLMVSDYVDPDAVDPRTYPAGMIVFNTRCSTNNVKEFKNVFKDLVRTIGNTYSVGDATFSTPGTTENPKTTRWVSASGNALDGSGLFGSKAQRAMIVKALASAIVSNNEIRADNIDFWFANSAGYPELDDEFTNLNTDKREMFYHPSDTPKTLSPDGKDIIDWATNANNAASHGEGGRVIMNAYQSRTYPSMGITTNVDGSEIAVPTSIAKMKGLLTLPRGQICAGTGYGEITNLASVGYITEEGEYSPVQVDSGIGPIITQQNMIPILAKKGTGLMFWGESTENTYDSSLSDEHAIVTILRLKRKLEEGVVPFFFKINTPSLRSDFHKILADTYNEFIGTNEIYDYAVVTDDNVNTFARINRKELWGNSSCEIAKGVEQIYLPIRIMTAGSISQQ